MIALAEDRLNTDTLCKRQGQQSFCCKSSYRQPKSTAVRQGTGECLQLDRGVQRLQGVVQTQSSYLQFPTKKGKKDPNDHFTEAFSVFWGREGSTSYINRYSEFSVAFCGSRDG